MMYRYGKIAVLASIMVLIPLSGCPGDVNGGCGDGTVDSDEECDDGNFASGDGCSAECMNEAECGDGIVDILEECDDGNNVDGDGCSAECTNEAECGDGNVDGLEECDDGNTVDGDGCDSMCQTEAPPLTEPAMQDDPLSDFIDSISTLSAGRVSTVIDIQSYGALNSALSAFVLNFYFGAGGVFECATRASALVLCPTTPAPIPEGDVVRVVTTFNDMIPLADPDNSYVYSVVFESDGNPMNDWQYNVPFDWDLFQGSDRWYQATWDHVAGDWAVTVSQVDDSQNINAVSNSTAHAVIEGNRVKWFISLDELPAGAGATYRTTSFIHDGAFTEGDRGADVPGAAPTEPLIPLRF